MKFYTCKFVFNKFQKHILLYETLFKNAKAVFLRRKRHGSIFMLQKNILILSKLN